MQKLKIGIIGVGNIAETHIKAYLKNPNIELYAFCDINENRLHEMGEKYGVANLFTNKDEMLKLSEIDAVSVCTWNSEHAPCTIAALNSGKHVLCEKPNTILPSPQKYRVALIGCGCMGEAHLDNICRKSNVIIQYVCDTNVDRAIDFFHKYNAQHYETDYKKVVSSKDVDIVIISTYPSSHLEILEECLKNKKHILCEKPIAQNFESGEKIVNLIKSHPECKVLIGYILRHNKTYQRVADMIRSGAIGKPIIMRMAQNHHTMDWQKYLNLICETSPIIDCGVHYLDVMRWFTGEEITEVSGIGLKTEADVPDGKYNYGLITARLSKGSIAYYEAGWSNTMSSDNLKEFVGPKGRIRIVYESARQSHQEEGDLIEYYTYPERKYENINIKCNRKPTDDQLQELIDMIEQNKDGSPTIDDVWTSFQWAIKADEIIRHAL